MKKILVLILSFYGFVALAQEKNVLKPEYIIIANNEIISKEKLEDYAKQGVIKSMKKSVTEEQRNAYAKKFGDKIGDKEFIIKIDLLTEQERLEREKKQASIPQKTIGKKDRSKELILNIDDLASDFTVQMVNGTEITLSELKGKVVFINYWATWCAPCLMEFAEFPDKILNKFDKEDLVFIPIAIGENKEKALRKMQKMQKYGVDFNVGVDPDRTIWNQYASGAIPKSFIIDKKGVIKYVSIGNSEGSVDKLALEIEKLLK